MDTLSAVGLSGNQPARKTSIGTYYVIDSILKIRLQMMNKITFNSIVFVLITI